MWSKPGTERKVPRSLTHVPSKTVDLIEVDSGMVVPRGWGEEEEAEVGKAGQWTLSCT
jgi:hypothetical protein